MDLTVYTPEFVKPQTKLSGCVVNEISIKRSRRCNQRSYLLPVKALLKARLG